MAEETIILRCENCNSRQVYTLKSGVVVCRKCGFRKEKKESESNE